jgi:hypothetical protein
LTIPRHVATGPPFAYLTLHRGGDEGISVVWRDGVWLALGGEPEHAIGACENRDALIELTCRVAARHNGEVYVCDQLGRLDVVHLYSGGAESIRYPLPARLRLIPKK